MNLVFIKKPTWGIIVQKKLGVHISIKKLTAAKLITAIETVQTDEIKTNEFVTGQAIRNEPGFENAVTAIKNYFPTEQNENQEQDNHMDESWVSRWDERYSDNEFAYGKQPNNYLKEQLEKLTPGGAILFPANLKSAYHKAIDTYLQKGGIIIFEAFSKKHIEFIARDEKVGGPKDVAMLFSIDEIKSDFSGYELIELVEKEIELSEGLFHNGQGSVIRFVGRKRS